MSKQYPDDADALKRYQQCVGRILAWFPNDPLPENNSAHFLVERLEALVSERLISPSGFTCACGLTHNLTIGIGPGWMCRCGRKYDRPTFDVERLCQRIDTLEREVTELREWKAKVTT